MTKQEFIAKIAVSVKKYAEGYGIKVHSPIIAQAILESGWGESKLASQYHNYFGLKCGTKWTGKSVNLTTQEEYTVGTLTTIKDNFRVFDSMDDGVKGYFEFIQLARYQNLRGITDPEIYLKTIKEDGYATSSTYVENNMKLIRQCDLTQYDKKEGTDMTEAEQRKAVVNWLAQYQGIAEGSAQHKAILKVFNDSGLCTRYKMTVNDAWCAASASAAFIANGLGSIFPVECSCWYMIQIAKQRGIWVENDAYVPSIGDAVLYDWDDSGAGDNQGNPDHVGLVMNVSGSTMQIIEGNKSNTVGIRTLQINSRYIRGYVTPKFTGTAAAPKTDSTDEASGTALNRNVKWTGVVTADELNVRTWAGVNNATCSFSPLKEHAEIGVCDSVKASDGSVWYYIKYNGKYGFVHSDWVKQKASTNTSTGTKVTATDYAKQLDKSIAGTYETTDDLNMRHGAGTGKGVMTVIPKGIAVQNYGYYSVANGTKWLYVQVTIKGVTYTGFCSGKYLRKL